MFLQIHPATHWHENLIYYSIIARTNNSSRPAEVHKRCATGLEYQLCDHASELPLSFEVKLKKFATVMTDGIILDTALSLCMPLSIDAHV